MTEPIYEVFARKTREEPLRHIGVLNAPDDELARVYAWKTYDEQNWFEMSVVRRTALLSVTHRDSPRIAPRRGLSGNDVLHSSGAASYGGSEVADARGRVES